ncbi:MAG: hypothetical protein ACLTQI_07640 [Slackia sp.]
MLNFTVGPVQSDERICALGANQVPYFRTPEFSEVMLENERLFLKFAGAPEGSRAVFLTGSGTAGMEAAVMNTLDASDKAIVVDGGSFGHRFVKLLEVHGIEHTASRLRPAALLPKRTSPRLRARATRRCSSTCAKPLRAWCTIWAWWRISAAARVFSSSWTPSVHF